MPDIILKIIFYIFAAPIVLFFIIFIAWAIISGTALAIAERKNYHRKLDQFEEAVAKLDKILVLKFAIEDDISTIKHVPAELINSYTAIIAHQNTIFADALYWHTECNRPTTKILFAPYKPYRTRLKEANKLFASLPNINTCTGELIFKKYVLGQLYGIDNDYIIEYCREP